MWEGGERTHRAAALCVRARVPAGAEARDAARRPVKPIRGNERKRKSLSKASNKPLESR